MCTKIIRLERKGRKFKAYKTVKVTDAKEIESPYYSFTWVPSSRAIRDPNMKHKSRKLCMREMNFLERGFHCFKNLEDARIHRHNKSSYIRATFAIIEVEVSGVVYSGITGGMGVSHSSNKDAFLASNVKWNGKISFDGETWSEIAKTK